VVAVTAPPPALTVNESRRKKEDNMAVIFMGFILVSGAPPWVQLRYLVELKIVK
jgi:hypothetical protein